MTWQNDDPRKLRELLGRVGELAREHSVPSVVVGLSAEEGDLRFPEFVDFVESALRVEDHIFRMTRERAVVHLADVSGERAREVVERLLADFSDEFPSATSPRFAFRLLGVEAGPGDPLTVKDVLISIFAGEDREALH